MTWQIFFRVDLIQSLKKISVFTSSVEFLLVKYEKFSDTLSTPFQKMNVWAIQQTKGPIIQKSKRWKQWTGFKLIYPWCVKDITLIYVEFRKENLVETYMSTLV